MLTSNDIETAIEQSPNKDIIKKSISNYFENLDEPVIVAISLNGNGIDRGINRDTIQNIVNDLRQKGIDAVSFMDEAASDPSKFVVNSEGIQTPFLSPDDALKATVIIEDVVCNQDRVHLSGHANLLSNDSILYSKGKKVETLHNQLLDIKDSNPHADKIPEILSKYGEDFDTFIDRKVSEASAQAITIDKDKEVKNNSMNGRENLWRGATLIGKPYAVISPRNARKVAYASSIIRVSDGYTGYTNTASGSGGAMYPNTKSGKRYGCLFKFKSIGDEQIYYEDTGLEAAANGVKMKNDEIGLGFETAVYHHRNKLEAMYLQVGEDKFFPIPIDEKGRITDSEWRDFAALHEASDSSVYGYEAIRRDTQKQEQDLNPHHCYKLELGNSLENKHYNKTYFKAEDIAKAIAYRENWSKDNDGHINIYQNVNIDINMDQADLKNITVYGTCTINNEGTKSILNVPNIKDTENGPSTKFDFIGNGKLTDVDKISTEQLLKITNSNKDVVMIGSNIELDTLPKDFNQKTYNFVSINSTVEKLEDFPDTVMGCNYLKVKDQSSIENMDADIFRRKVQGKYKATVEQNLDLSTTNIVNFPKSMSNETLEKIKFNPNYEVKSLDNCPNTKQGIFGIKFSGSLENLTMEEFLTKVKGEDWCKDHILKQPDGISIVKDLDLEYSNESFKITKYPKDIAKYSFNSNFAYRKQSQMWNNAAIKTQLLELKNNDIINVTANQALAVGDMSEFKCNKIIIKGKNEDLSSFKLPSNVKNVSLSNISKLPTVNEQCSAITLTSCDLENNIDLKHIDDVRLENCSFSENTKLDLSKCKRVSLSNVDLSKVNIKLPEQGKVYINENVKFAPDRKLDFSKCQDAIVHPGTECSEIKLPARGDVNFDYTGKLHKNVKEVSAEYISNHQLSVPDGVKIIDAPMENGKKVSLERLSRAGVSKEQIADLRKERLLKPFKDIYNKLTGKNNQTQPAANENTPELKETLKEQTKNAHQAKNAPAQTPAVNGDLHNTLKTQKESSSIGSKVSAVSNAIDNTFEKAGKVLNDNAAGRMINKIDSWRPQNKVGAKVVGAAGAVPTAAIAATGVSAYEQYKSGDKKGAAATMAKGTVHATIQGAATAGGMNLAAKGLSKGTEKVVTKVAEHNLAKKAAQKTAVKTAEKAATKAAVKAGAKAAGKAAGKAVLKKIPLVSLGAGLYFAYERAKKGEWGKAVGEVCSGAAGCVPGVGTAISTGIDCGLAVADTKQAINETKKQQAAKQAPQTQAQKPQQKTVTAQRVAELRGIKPAQSQQKPVTEKKQQKPIEKGVWNKLTNLFSR